VPSERKIAKKLPKRCGRSKGSWVSIHNGRANKDRSLPNRDPRRGINFPNLGDVGSAAYRRLLQKGGRR
jgi:hypothetical protein